MRLHKFAQRDIFKQKAASMSSQERPWPKHSLMFPLCFARGPCCLLIACAALHTCELIYGLLPQRYMHCTSTP